MKVEEIALSFCGKGDDLNKIVIENKLIVAKEILEFVGLHSWIKVLKPVELLSAYSIFTETQSMSRRILSNNELIYWQDSVLYLINLLSEETLEKLSRE